MIKDMHSSVNDGDVHHGQSAAGDMMIRLMAVQRFTIEPPNLAPFYSCSPLRFAIIHCTLQHLPIALSAKSNGRALSEQKASFCVKLLACSNGAGLSCNFEIKKIY